MQTSMDDLKALLVESIEAAARGDVQAFLIAQTLLSHLGDRIDR